GARRALDSGRPGRRHRHAPARGDSARGSGRGPGRGDDDPAGCGGRALVRLRRILVPAEMTGRELARRGFALGLLTALPLAFYGASTHSGSNAVITGG